MLPRRCLVLLIGLLCALPAPAAAPPRAWQVGVARVDLTPSYPVRLSGFGFRRDESEGVQQRLWVRALAIGDRDPAVLLTIDNLGVPSHLVAELARRMERHGVRPERLAVTATHTHTAPMLSGALATLFGVPIPKDHLERIDRYTKEFLDRLEKAAVAALADRRPARLAWGVGRVGFAVNRRARGGPVDHDLPLLVVRDPASQMRAVLVSYACHAVTLSHNRVGGDWPGHAAEAIEAAVPGAVALVAIGCGADSNPDSGVTGGKVEVAAVQGRQIAAEARRLLGGYLAPVDGPLLSARESFTLPLAALPTREVWQQRAARTDAVGYHARVQLERLGRGEQLPTKIDYSVTSWSFGDALALVFLPGEVVADYSLRLKKQLDGRRLWVNAYSNGAPCYIPSERVLKAGGYEGGGAMTYYDLPAPLAPGLEDTIVAAVRRQLGRTFAAPVDPDRTGGTLPLSPQQSAALLRTNRGLAVDLVAAEPLVASPVAIDFGPDGRLWVAEMVDYPGGLRGGYEPGGRIRVLEDSDGDGRFDRSRVFLDGIPFPTGVTVWRGGVLVCAAPDILYAEDRDGDGRADEVRKLYSGFGTDNYQARVNSLCYGLDGWVYGSCGLFGGRILSHRTGQTLALGNRDFRIRPDSGEIEPVTGRTQQGLARDDWGHWFGCDNSTLARHHVLADEYLRRNPHLAFTDVTVHVPSGPDATRLYPARSDVQRFLLSGPAGRPTAACGLGVYRDDRLGADHTGNLFVCESVNHLVHRLQLTPRGASFAGHRAAEEATSEFLASTDPWHRPVQARGGPDGGLWVVDMYRYLIEHPRWLPAADLARIDPRAGAGLGRIYRVRRTDQPPRPPTRLDRLDPAGLVAALDSANGWQRDMAQQMLLWRDDRSAAPALARLVGHPRPQTRLHALCILGIWDALRDDSLRGALADAHPGVRRQAVRLCEPRLASDASLATRLAALADDSDGAVRLQVACSLGYSRDARSSKALITLVKRHPHDIHLSAAVLSSLRAGHLGEALPELLAGAGNLTLFARQALPLAVAAGDSRTVTAALDRLGAAPGGRLAPWQRAGLSGVLDALLRRHGSLERLPDVRLRDRLGTLLAAQRATALDEKAAEVDRLAAVAVLGRSPDDVAVLTGLLSPRHGTALQGAALSVLRQRGEGRIADDVLAAWKGLSPAVQLQALDLLTGRPNWTVRLLEALESKAIPTGQIDAVRRQRLLGAADPPTRRRAEALFAAATDRQKVVDAHQDVLALSGDPARGKTAFARVCAVCHRLDGVGHVVGPDLVALAGKAPGFWLTEILDPNRNLDSRYARYAVTTVRGLSHTGLLAAETASSVTLRGPEGKDVLLLRSEIEDFVGSGKSLMPEGLEQDLTRRDLADLLAYLGGLVAMHPVAADAPAALDVKTLAARVLDDALPRQRREALVAAGVPRAAELLPALVAGMQPGTKEEYRRIPWIWRVTVAAGKRNDGRQLVELLEASLPRAGEPLHDWQAVVLGGGLINGVSLAGDWPGPRLEKLIADKEDLKTRWKRALDQAATMADAPKVPTGTRYDALRMIALAGWEQRGAQLTGYLAKGTHPELAMGAVSGLADLDAPPVAPALLGALAHLTPTNRRLAVEALLRTPRRALALLAAIDKKTVSPTLLSSEQVRALTSHGDARVRQQARRLFPRRSE